MGAGTATGPSGAAIALRGLVHAWPGQAPVLDIESLEIAAGERLFISGPSGSGKSTLLAVIGGVIRPDQGEVRIFGEDLAALGVWRRDAFRADRIGFIFQMFNLLPYLSLVDNTTLPCRFSRRRRARAEAAGGDMQTEARRLLARLGLHGDGILRRPVTELSIGQQQRVAAARALIGQPDLVIADEPTSSLDADNRSGFLELLLAEGTAAGSTIIFVSHDQALAGHFDRSIALGDINRAGLQEAGHGR